MRRWRAPLLLSAAVLLAQLAHRSPLVDVVSGGAPTDVGLVYALWHIVFAPLTLLADWLNGGGRHDITGFVVWALLLFALARLVRRGAKAPKRQGAGWEPAVREAAAWALFALVLSGFIAWAAFLPRPIPRLETRDTNALVFDVHSHTSLSHDGRPGFGAAANAAWHARAGFDAAFVTDHNRFGVARQWRTEAPFREPRLLDGEELSLSGLHLIVLGNTREIDNRGFNTSWDSTGALIRRLASDAAPVIPSTPSFLQRPFLIASLPEYWRKHWGAELGDLVGWGVEGFEIWTTAPRAMDFPPGRRREVIARARLSGLVLFGATDMHGYGNAATVWNVAHLPRWRAMDDTTLVGTLLRHWRARGAEANQVVAVARWAPESRVGTALALPANLWLLLRTASRPHGAALLAWFWLPALLARMGGKQKG
ncbi:MAG: hypothetical protein HY705_01780 [Gemmatimonadetes bacterium]|nr:hypothetical protein [Gemmatimonadota bacterium]